MKGIETKGQTGSLQEVSAAAGMHPKLAPAARASYSCFDFVRAGPGVETQRTPGALLGGWGCRRHHQAGSIATLRKQPLGAPVQTPPAAAAAMPPTSDDVVALASPACLLRSPPVRARRANARCRGRASATSKASWLPRRNRIDREISEQAKHYLLCTKLLMV